LKNPRHKYIAIHPLSSDVNQGIAEKDLLENVVTAMVLLFSRLDVITLAL